jgi:3'-5' exonuclease
MQENVGDLLYFDIETAPAYRSFQDMEKLNPAMAELWIMYGIKKGFYQADPDSHPTFHLEPVVNAEYIDRAALHAEFGKIVCISFCISKYKAWRRASFSATMNDDGSIDDYAMLKRFQSLLTKYPRILCGYNIKGFDMPFVQKHFLANKIEVPPQLKLGGVKPWEVRALDLMELWSSRERPPFALVCEFLGVPTPKDEMSGPDVRVKFWEGKNDEIVRYCEKDVVASIKVAHRMVDIYDEVQIEDLASQPA